MGRTRTVLRGDTRHYYLVVFGFFFFRCPIFRLAIKSKKTGSWFTINFPPKGMIYLRIGYEIGPRMAAAVEGHRGEVVQGTWEEDITHFQVHRAAETRGRYIHGYLLTIV